MAAIAKQSAYGRNEHPGIVWAGTFGAGSLDGEEGLVTERHRKHNESRKDQRRCQMSERLSIPQQSEERADHDHAGQRQA